VTGTVTQRNFRNQNVLVDLVIRLLWQGAVILLNIFAKKRARKGGDSLLCATPRPDKSKLSNSNSRTVREFLGQNLALTILYVPCSRIACRPDLCK